MTISSLSRSSFSAPLSRTSSTQPLTAPARSVESAQARQPTHSLRQQLMTDAFEQGPRRLGDALGSGKAVGASDGLDKVMQEMSQVLEALAQLIKGLQGPTQGGQDSAIGGPSASAGKAAPMASAGAGDSMGGAAAPSPSAQTPAAAPQAQASAPTASAASSAEKPSYPTFDNGAGPGFGKPSAGSTEPAPANQPWLAKNNVGSPYNSNMQLIDASQKGQFKYTNTFTNNTDKPQTVTLWNKTGQNGNPNDGQNFDKSTPKTFTLEPGQSQTVAFDTNSSVAWSVSKDGSAKPGVNSGQTWGEATFANSATGWSGYDVSQISPAGHNGNMSISNEATGKTVTQANAWQTPSDDPAGKDVGVPAGPLHLKTAFS
jgi:hypothetical protein